MIHRKLLVCSYSLTTLLLGEEEGSSPGKERQDFFFSCCCFRCFRPPPPEMAEKIGKREVACFPRFASRLDTHRARAEGCCWGCYWLDATGRMDFVTGSTLHSGCRLCLLVRLTCEVEAPTPPRTTTTTWRPRSCSNPPQTLSGLLNRNNGSTSSVLTARRARKIARVVTHDCRSWVLATDCYNYDTLKENKWSDDWPYNVTSSNCQQGSLCVLTVHFPSTAATTDEGNRLSWKALLTIHSKSPRRKRAIAVPKDYSVHYSKPGLLLKTSNRPCIQFEVGLEQRWNEFSTTILPKQDKCTVFYSLHPLI